MEKILSPALIVDEDRCRRNIRHMARKARQCGIGFRPHFKTHQSLGIGSWFRDTGVDRIAVSSVSMANYFASGGWNDIMIAFPLNVREINLINQLAAKIKLSVLLADAFALNYLETGLSNRLEFYIKIDVGNRRSGFNPDDTESISHILEKAASIPHLVFKGFIAHAGQTYLTQSLNEVQKIYNTGTRIIHAITTEYRKNYPDIITSWGDTPTCSLINQFDLIDEIRPGNFVFYDLTQYLLGSCDLDHIAAVVAAPVVTRQPGRSEIVLYAGAVHLSKDVVSIPDVGKVYGEIVRFSPDGWLPYPDPVYLNRLSQEHGVFACPHEYLDDFLPGNLVGIIPVHSCLAADLLRHNKYFNLKTGEFFI